MKILRDRRGNASIEFAFLSLFFFAGVMVALDLGLYIQQKLKLGYAVEQGAMLAYNTKVGSTTSGISSYISTYSGTRVAPTVTITCNGTTTCGDGKCSCINATTGVFTLAGSCGAVCPAGSTTNSVSGNYLKIVASETYQAMVVPNRLLGGSTLSQTAVVRLP